eukprot:1272539-Rhodomonas_salina.1
MRVLRSQILYCRRRQYLARYLARYRGLRSLMPLAPPPVIPINRPSALLILLLLVRRAGRWWGEAGGRGGRGRSRGGRGGGRGGS